MPGSWKGADLFVVSEVRDTKKDIRHSYIQQIQEKLVLRREPNLSRKLMNHVVTTSLQVLSESQLSPAR